MARNLAAERAGANAQGRASYNAGTSGNYGSTEKGGGGGDGNNRANYPIGKTKDLSLTGGLKSALGGPTGVVGGMLTSAAKAFWNQTSYGMNDKVKDKYDALVKAGIPKGQSVKDTVNLAREAYYVDNPAARGDPRNGETGGVEFPAGSGQYISTDDNKIQTGDGEATYTVNPDSGEVIEGKEEAKLGEIELSKIDPSVARPSWAPYDPNYVDPNAYVKTPYDIARDQEFLGMDEWQRQEDAKAASNVPAKDPYAPSAPVTGGPRPDWAPANAPEGVQARPDWAPTVPTGTAERPDWAPTIPKDTDSTYDKYAPTWNSPQATIPEDGMGGYYVGGSPAGERQTGGMLTQTPQAPQYAQAAQAPQYAQAPQAPQARPQSQAAAVEIAARQGMLLPQVSQAPQSTQATLGLQAPIAAQGTPYQAQNYQGTPQQFQAAQGLQAPIAAQDQGELQAAIADQAKAFQAQAYQAQAPTAAAAAYQAQAPRGTPAYESLQNTVAGTSSPVAEAMQLDTQATPVAGAPIPKGAADSGTFKPVTFRSGTGTSTTDADGTTTRLNDPYSSLSNLVGSGQGLLTQAAGNAQRAPDQLSFNMDTDQRASDLFAQRSALLEPAFAQQRALAKQDMFGSGRLGLRLSGESVGAGADSGMVQPDAFGMNQAQSQALAGLASQSTDDAFARAQAVAGLDSQRFTQNQQAQQQQYTNLMGSGQGMLSAGIQGAQIEAGIAQQQSANQQAVQDQRMSQARLALDTQAQQQNFGLAAQGQSQDYGLNAAQFNLASQGQQQNFGLAQQTQDQAYGLNQQRFRLDEQGQMQDYGLSQDRASLAQQVQNQANAAAQQQAALAQQAQNQANAMAQQQLEVSQRSQQLAELSNNRDFILNQGRLALDAQGQSQNYDLNAAKFNLDSQGQERDFSLNQGRLSLETTGQERDFSLNQGRLALDTSGQAQDYGLNSAQFNLASQGQERDYMLSNRSQSLAELSNSQNYGMAGRGQNLAELNSSRDYDINKGRLALDAQGQQQNYGLADRGQSLAELSQRENQSLANLSNTQNYGLNTSRLALDTLGQADNLALATQGQNQNYGLQQQQQMQDYGLNQQKMDLATQQQLQDYGVSQQNYGLAQQQQLQDYGFNQQNFGLAQQQQRQDYGFNQQNYGLAQQQQYQDYGLNQQKMAMAGQQQLQDYEMGMLTGNRDYNLRRDVAAQNYELATEGNRIGLITGQAQANKNNYQPNDLLNLAGGAFSAYAGTAGGAAQIGSWLNF